MICKSGVLHINVALACCKALNKCILECLKAIQVNKHCKLAMYALSLDRRPLATRICGGASPWRYAKAI